MYFFIIFCINVIIAEDLNNKNTIINVTNSSYPQFTSLNITTNSYNQSSENSQDYNLLRIIIFIVLLFMLSLCIIGICLSFKICDSWWMQEY